MCKVNIYVYVFCFKYRGYRGSGKLGKIKFFSIMWGILDL